MKGNVNLYQEKQDYFISELKLLNTPTAAFYRDIFPKGTFEDKVGKQDNYEHTNKGNGFIVYTTENDTKRTRMVFDDLDDVFDLLDNPCAFMSPISYFGRRRTSKNARYLYALAFDLDDVGRQELHLLLTYHKATIPKPTYIVNSGGGVHLYYVLKEPMPMTPTNQTMCKELKYYLTYWIWNEDTSRCKQRQYQGPNQGFRLVGSKTKRGEEVTAWQVGDKVDLDYLIGFTPSELGLHYKSYKFESKMTLEQAKKKYPEWYHQRIELKRQKTNWTCKRDLYDWWKKQIVKASYHHRYFYVMSLAIYAVKCGISKDELTEDAYGCMQYLNSISPENPFTKEDVDAALQCYQENYRSYPRDDISKISGIEIHENKRNGRKQEVHLKRARAVQDIDYPNGEWREGNGRKSVQDFVFQFLDENPSADYHCFCSCTGLQKSSFYKYRKPWLEAKKAAYDLYLQTFAFANRFDGCVKDSQTGEPIDLVPMITGVPAPSKPLSFEDFLLL